MSLSVFAKKLTQLGAAGRLLWFPSLRISRDADWADLDHEDGLSAPLLLDNFWQKQRIRLCKQTDSRRSDTSLLARRLRTIHRNEQQLYQETGTRSLQMALFMVQGCMPSGQAIRCPLVLLPVSLKLENHYWQLTTLEKTAEPALNKTFLLTYAREHGLTLPNELYDHNFEACQDIDTLKTNLYNLFKKYHIDINFTTRFFEQRTESILPFKKQDFVNLNENQPGKLQVVLQAFIGQLPQPSPPLAADYDTLLAQNQSIESLFSQNPNQPLQEVKAEHQVVPFDIDGSQEQAIKKLLSGQSVVVQGPPGTGKSQLIANTTAAYLAQGKKVLIVCQKKAALDVVSQRLGQLQLSPFLATVHDYKNDRTTLFQKVQYQISLLNDYRQELNQLDSIQTERRYTQISRRIDSISDQLDGYKTALFDSSFCKMTAKELYLSYQPEVATINLGEDFAQMLPIQIADKQPDIERFALYFPLQEKANYWQNRLPLTHKELAYKQLLADWLAGWSERNNKLLTDFHNKTGQTQATQREKLANHRDTLLNWQQARPDLQPYILLLLGGESNLYGQLKDLQSDLLSAYQNRPSLPDTQAEKLDEVYRKSEQLLTKRQAFAGALRWTFSQEYKEIKAFLKTDKLTEQAIEQLQNDIKKEQLWQEHQGNWQQITKLTVEEPEAVFQLVEEAYTLHKKLSFLPTTFYKYVKDSLLNRSDVKADFKEVQQRIDFLINYIDTAEQLCEEAQSYFSNDQIADLLASPDKANGYQKQWKQHFDAMLAFDELMQRQPDFFKKWLYASSDFFKQKNEKTTAAKAFLLLKNSLYYYWIEAFEEQFPALRLPAYLDKTAPNSVSEMSLLENELASLLTEKQRLAAQMVLQNVKEKAIRHLDKNRLGNVTTYRSLQHQTAKKRQRWSIRKLFEQEQEPLQRLLPCWLTSPETASALFPLTNGFDLIIFDEASQCYAAHGLPALVRANQSLIAGDSQQMPPSDLYQSQFYGDDEQELSAEEEAVSLLELAEHHLPTCWLTGHYRSQHPALIHFSNKHFYKERLQTLPNRLYVGKPIHYEYVLDGRWHNRQNEPEARQVVRLFEQIRWQEPQAVIGVVAFNMYQQNLILDLLEQAGQSPFTKPDGPPVFWVKNLENAQGDECDHLILSSGYAPQENGRLSMNFGSLNRPGGENRLNVAVTRARRSVNLVTSLKSSFWKQDAVISRGAVLLGEYIAYAEQMSRQFNKQENGLPDFLRKEPPSLSLAAKLINQQPDEWRTALPFADLESKITPGLLCLTDDDRYRQTDSAAEAHVYLPHRLEQKGWKTDKVYTKKIKF